MFDQLRSSEAWLLHSAVAGGGMLLVGAAVMFFVRQPVRRQRVGEISLLASLVVAGLCALPTWLPVRVPYLDRFLSEPAVEAKSAVVPAPPVMQRVLIPVRIVAVPGQTASRPPVAEVKKSKVPQTVPATVETEPEVTAALSPVSYSPHWSVILYMLIAGSLFARCLFGYIALWRLYHSSQPAHGHEHRLFAELTRDWKRKPRLRISKKIIWPISFGIFRPTVVLPARFCEASRLPSPLGGAEPGVRGNGIREIEFILTHELTHLWRRDAISCLLMAVAQSLYFYLPWFWWLRRQVRLCQEYLADAAAAALASSEDYAQYLVTLARSGPTPTGRMAASAWAFAGILPDDFPATGMFGRSSTLFRRITMLLNTQKPVERSAPRGWTLAAAGGFLSLAVILSGVRLYADDKEKTPPASDSQSQKKSEAEQARETGEVLKFFAGFNDNAASGDNETNKRLDALEKQLKELREMLQKAGKKEGGNPAADRRQFLEDMNKQFLEAAKREPTAYSVNLIIDGKPGTIPNFDYRGVVSGTDDVLTVIYRKKDNKFCLTHGEDPFVYGIKGEIINGNANLTEITVRQIGGSGETVRYAKLDQVPEKHKGMIKMLTEMSEKKTAKSEPKK